MNKYTAIRGFNYQPSYAATTYESWRYFDPQIWELELRRGKGYFPGINAMRLWLDWGAWVQDPVRFGKNFEKALSLVHRICNAQTVVCLFNRWHNNFLDAGGMYIDHFVKGWSWVDAHEERYAPYINDIVGSHKDDDRVLIWDYCNEPFTYKLWYTSIPEIEEAEFQWLAGIYRSIKAAGAKQNASVSTWPRTGLMERVEPISDVLLIHPYYSGIVGDKEYEAKWLAMLDAYEEISKTTGKPLLITECCHGNGIDWQTRVAVIHQELAEYARRKIGFMPHALHHSLIADLHIPEFGPIFYIPGDPRCPGAMEFIDHEGILRPGHDAFNLY